MGSEVWTYSSAFLFPGMCPPRVQPYPGSPPSRPLIYSPQALALGPRPRRFDPGWKQEQQCPPRPRWHHAAPSQATVFTPNSPPRVTGEPLAQCRVKGVAVKTGSSCAFRCTPASCPHRSTRGPAGTPRPREAGLLSVRLYLQLSPTPPFLLGGLGRWTPVPLCALLPHQGTQHFQAELCVEAEGA